MCKNNLLIRCDYSFLIKKIKSRIICIYFFDKKIFYILSISLYILHVIFIFISSEHRILRVITQHLMWVAFYRASSYFILRAGFHIPFASNYTVMFRFFHWFCELKNGTIAINSFISLTSIHHLTARIHIFHIDDSYLCGIWFPTYALL